MSLFASYRMLRTAYELCPPIDPDLSMECFIAISQCEAILDTDARYPDEAELQDLCDALAMELSVATVYH